MKWEGLSLLWLLLLPALAAVGSVLTHLSRRGIAFSNVRTLASLKPGWKVRWRRLPLGLHLLALSLILLALLRPQLMLGEEEVKIKGINIMLVTDLSGSMEADDLKPDRITAEKKVLEAFVRRTKNDQVGLVVFGAKSFTQSPLTLDHEVLANAIKETDLNTVDADGTAIGDGILTAVNRFAEVPGQTNVMVLATDGTNNKGIDPAEAAEIAAARRIRIYIIGIGSKGGAPIYAKDEFGSKTQMVRDGKPMRWEEPNDQVLKQLATKTNGEYFRATDETSLDKIYEHISQMIKDEKKRRDPHYQDIFHYFLLAAMACLLLESILAATWLRSLA